MSEIAEISDKYNPALTEKWYQYWLDNKFFAAKPNPDKKPYTIVIPPPNVTGVLHMGHMLNNTIQDILIRRARMQGFEACWVPGTDHASIATEAKVVNMLKEKGIEKKSLSREEFLDYAWEWTHKYGGIILEQLKKLGASCDWDRTRFTMEESLSDAVIEVFIDLYNKGYIYRDYRMVNWDPKGKTALSDEEVVYKEVNSKLYFVKYQVVGTDDFVIVATTRPETILADTAICVNPNDERFKHLHGKKVLVPFINREIPIITDEYVAMDFGTGCLKVTPAHDINDYELGKKHNLEIIDILNEDGTLNERCQIPTYIGKDRFTVRKIIAKDLEAIGQLSKTEDYKSNVGYSERNPDSVAEPRISIQWWLRMEDLAKPALVNVLNDNIKFYPDKFKNMYRSWMENVRDWCISRQLWWGHRIPAWYNQKGELVAVAKTKAEALLIANKGLTSVDGFIQAAERGNITDDEIPRLYTENELKQDEDVLDTWFSSWLWPISVFDGFKDPNNADVNYFYPTDTLVTAPEIIFFWVARMIIAGYEFKGELPFKNVYFTGIVRDKQGRKMSKQLGNSPDPIDLMNIYGADGVRTGMLFSSQAGNDLMFDEKQCELGRNFSNKIFNAFQLLKGGKAWNVTETEMPSSNALAISWFESTFNQGFAEIEDHFTKFRISDALLKVKSLVWDDFCSWYLEMVKPEYGKPIDKPTYEATAVFFDKVLRLVHPFMPFITEELWQTLQPRANNDSICIAPYSEGGSFDNQIIKDGIQIQNLISQIRNLKNGKGVSPKLLIPLTIKTSNTKLYQDFEAIIQKLAGVGEITFTETKIEGTAGFIVGTDEFFLLFEEELDITAEIEKAQTQLDYELGFKESVLKKLSNEKFVQNAKPEVVEAERKKLADAESRIKTLEESLALLKKKV
jgi:valyl-tRNA synthetase